MTTLAHISDLQIPRVEPDAMEALVADLHAIKPSLLVVSGDITQRARQGQFDAARAYLARLPRPQLVVPGNHDLPLFAFWRRVFSPLGRFRRILCADAWPVWSDGRVYVLGMNTATRVAPRLSGFWKDGIISRDRCRQIAERFAPAPSGAVRVLVAHHPFIEPPGGHHHGVVHGASRAVPVLEQAGVDLILSGHLHQTVLAPLGDSYPALRRPILQAIAGSACSTRRREAHNAYNVIAIGDSIDVRVRRFVDGRWGE